jgi:DOPA 4,5-dioxygenase
MTEAAATSTGVIQGWHAHVYYDAASRSRAEQVRAGLAASFPDARLGRWHDQPIGPHTRAMFQVAFGVERLALLLPWLMLNRLGLAVLVHPETGRERSDHTVHAAWLGEMLDVKLDALSD